MTEMHRAQRDMVTGLARNALMTMRELSEDHPSRELALAITKTEEALHRLYELPISVYNYAEVEEAER